MRIHSFGMAAAKLSAMSSNHRFRLGACIVRKNEILSTGFNKADKTHPRSNTNYNTIHAEFDALNRVWNEDLRGCYIYICRIMASGMFGLAKPCSCCMQLIAYKKLKYICYTDDSGGWKLLRR